MDFTKVTTAEMTYDKNNRLLTYNGEQVQYDKDGNMTYGPLNGTMSEFVFDCRNRLIQAGNTIYEYDAENNRIAVTTGTKRTEYVVNTQPELSQILQSKTYEVGREDTAQTTYYYYGKGLLAQENSNGYLTYHFNNVGSTMAVTDAIGAVVTKYNYSPYGELLEGEYNANIPFLYNGQFGVMTDGNGLYYMRARYYNVDIKRFINQDVLVGTLERISSLNRFAYVEGNPVSYLDPFGLEKSYWEQMHEDLQNLNCVFLVIQALVACVMVIVPEFIPIGMIIEEALAAGSTACAILDSFALFMMGRQTTVQKEKVAYALQALGNIVDIFTGNALAKKILKSCDNSDVAKIITQTIPSIQQSFNNIIWE